MLSKPSSFIQTVHGLSFPVITRSLGGVSQQSGQDDLSIAASNQAQSYNSENGQMAGGSDADRK